MKNRPMESIYLFHPKDDNSRFNLSMQHFVLLDVLAFQTESNRLKYKTI